MTATLVFVMVAATSARWQEPIVSARYCFLSEANELSSAWEVSKGDRARIVRHLLPHLSSKDPMDRASASFALGMFGSEPQSRVRSLLAFETAAQRGESLPDEMRACVVSACFSLARNNESEPLWTLVLRAPRDGYYAAHAGLEVLASLERNAESVLRAASRDVTIARRVKDNVQSYIADVSPARRKRIANQLQELANHPADEVSKLATELLKLSREARD